MTNDNVGEWANNIFIRLAVVVSQICECEIMRSSEKI